MAKEQGWPNNGTISIILLNGQKYRYKLWKALTFEVKRAHSHVYKAYHL